ncbi:glycerate kinase [Haloferax sp. DFSO60]|uniref:glycerate kinase type-2 family protein n=1 Tax=Haloferax sp. DFSO60 TaxID=3388652 RepID=UPI00397B32B4
MHTFDARTPTPAHETAIECLRAGVEAVLPERVVHESVSLAGDTLTVADSKYDLSNFDRILVVGGGKAGDGVADALEPILGDRLDGGVVVTPNPGTGSKIDRLPGDHPVPSQRGVESTKQIIDLLSDLDERTLVLVAVTGGASAILPAPADGISLEDLRATTTLLLESGADIHDLNAVRKHLSTLKGGGLARLAEPATVVGLVLSDVVGNDLDVIASGPTAPDETTFDDALSVLDRFDLDVPDAVRARLESGAAGEISETPKPGAAVFDRVTNHVLADTFTALDAARDVARERGYEPMILSSRIEGEAREASKTHVAVASEVLATGNPLEPPAVVLSGGECTVTVRGDGDGGPNLEFCLSAGTEVPDGAVIASIDSDGKDGGTDVAGAIVDSESVEKRAVQAALAENDALPILRDAGALIDTGPTGTNVNDLRVVVLDN